jgi:hypothetical protein
MARNWNKLEQMGIKKPKPKRIIPKKTLWLMVFYSIHSAIAIALITWLVVYMVSPVTFMAKNDSYKINIPQGWKVAKNTDIMQFGGGLDFGEFTNMYVPESFDFQATGGSVGSVLTVTAFNNSKKSQDNLKKYYGNIGGLTADPEKYLLEEIQKDGIKMKNIDGYYSMKKGFPVGIFRKNGFTFIMHGNITNESDAKTVEYMIESIR